METDGMIKSLAVIMQAITCPAVSISSIRSNTNSHKCEFFQSIRVIKAKQSANRQHNWYSIVEFHIPLNTV